MKLMKHITIALVLCAIPAMAFGQDVECTACTHEVSVYMGEGGLIATADGAEKVTYVATCEGVTRSGELTANDDGVVSTLLNMDNGLACHGTHEKNGFQLGPIMDGGWYWITDDMHSAVGNLVSQDILENETTDITSAGDGVTMTMGKGAVHLKETSSGRVGILPNILPVMEMEPEMATPCGFAGAGTTASPFTRRDSSCMMGDGGTMFLATYGNSITGATTRVMGGDTVTRPGGTGMITITIDLWGNGTGAFLTDATAGGTNGIGFARGNAHVGTAANYAARASTRYTGVAYTVSAGGGVGGGEGVTAGAAVEGVDLGGSPDPNTVDVLIGASTANCSKTNNYSTPVTVTATVAADADQAQVTPSIKVGTGAAAGVAGQLKFTVVCPAASANQGQELVPENPFPTE